MLLRMFPRFAILLKRIREVIRGIAMPEETIIQSKIKWDALARKNARYYVLTDQGEEISEEVFRAAGKRDYEKLIKNDPFIQQHLNPFSDHSVLEIGVGIGRITEFLAGEFKTVSGVDISTEMISRAKERLFEKQNVTLVATDGEHYPFPNHSMDFVFSTIVFQHMPSVEVIRQNFFEIERVLKSNGIAKIQLRGVPTEKSNWFYGPAFTLNDLPELFKGINLSIFKTEGAGTKYFWVWIEKKP